jgi:hypothetical protein
MSWPRSRSCVAKERGSEWHVTGLMILVAFAARLIKTCRRAAYCSSGMDGQAPAEHHNRP